MIQNRLTFPNYLRKLCFVFMGTGGVTLFASLFLTDPRRAAFAYLVPFVYFLFISLGALFFLSIQYASSAGWSVNIRRLIESLTPYLIFASILLVPLIYYGPYLFEWFHKDHVLQDPILKGKAAYLNIPFFLIRLAVFFGGWLFFAHQFVRLSSLQDRDGDVRWTQKLVRYSIAFLFFFVISFSFLSVDLLMSLDAHWFSTIFGVYTFAGAFQSVLAVLILMTVYFIPRSGGRVSSDHLHDLGKFLMGMTLFWAYIAFSQYMLIWYANLPEETTFYIPRSKEPWMWVSLSLVVFKFAVPFVCLLPRWVKRHYKAVSVICILILIMQYVDVYWLVYPSYSEEKLYWGLLDMGFFIGFLGVFVYSIVRFFGKYSALPEKDPRGHESDAHHVTY